jgi:hypothetical protein
VFSALITSLLDLPLSEISVKINTATGTTVLAFNDSRIGKYLPNLRYSNKKNKIKPLKSKLDTGLISFKFKFFWIDFSTKYLSQYLIL